MTVYTVDKKKRITLPGTKPGQMFFVQPNPDGSVVLFPVQKQERKPAFPRGSLLKYLTPKRDKEQLAILSACVLGPIEPQ